MNQIDHIVVGANTRPSGQKWLKTALGVEVPLGGEHLAMGTHNCVMQAGGQTYFELIAINPQAQAPARPRWFSLDDTHIQDLLSERPRALCWAVSTPNLDDLVAHSPVDLGRITEMSRGDLRWRITIPDDGLLPEAGILPVFLEWPGGINPSQSQQDKGVRLSQITLSHPNPEDVTHCLTTLGCAHLVTVKSGERGLCFTLETPNGSVEID